MYRDVIDFRILAVVENRNFRWLINHNIKIEISKRTTLDMTNPRQIMIINITNLRHDMLCLIPICRVECLSV